MLGNPRALRRIWITALLLGIAVAFAADVSDNITNASNITVATRIVSPLTALYCILRNVLPILGFLLLMAAGVIYGVGQFLGTEIRAKAQSWAMACLVGALTMAILATIAPILVRGLAIGTLPNISCTPPG